ncbi:MAG TPA: hypothetical protein VN829_14575 [Dongiaceae bacterium]|nr:hypothetical protein [Dongiaceae bacterium]
MQQLGGKGSGVLDQFCGILAANANDGYGDGGFQTRDDFLL